MKKAKKLFAIALVLALALAMSVTAFAAGTNTITVNGAQGGETYKLYKMLDLTVNGTGTAFTYTVNTAWTAFFSAPGAGAAYVDIDTQGYVTWKSGKDTAEDMEAFGKAAAAFATMTALATETPAADGSFTFSALDPGYYLITSTNGTLATVDTTPTTVDAVVNEKNTDPIATKEVQEDSTSAWGDSNSAQIGDTVNFKVTITAKKGAKNYVLHDTMDSSLTFNSTSLAIAGLTEGTEYTLVTSGLVDGCTFEIRFVQSYLDTLTADTTLTVTYSATLNENAADLAGKTNEVKLTWGDASETVLSTTTTTTYMFEVYKHATGSATNLAGATFQLKDATNAVVYLIKESETEYRVATSSTETGAVDSFTTVGTGNIVIKGVDLDNYTLVETAAPEGYNKLSAPVSVTPTADNTYVVDVENMSGTELPSTGGIGTTIFYVVGSILVLGAVVLIITRRRMSAEK